MLMFYYMRKEILDSSKYKDQLIRGKYANNFSGLDLTQTTIPRLQEISEWSTKRGKKLKPSSEQSIGDWSEKDN